MICINKTTVFAHKYIKMLVKFKKSPYLCIVKKEKG